MASNKRGFTLVELVVVMAVLGILAGVLIVGLNPAAQFKKSRDGRRRADLEQIRSALEMCYADEGSYPVGSLSSGSNITCGGTTYMTIPADPLAGKSYTYGSADGITYSISASLDFNQDPDYPTYKVYNP